jgi:ribosome-associated heat shock protein Hsp15
VKLNGVAVKPGREVRVDDWLLVSNASGEYELRIVGLSETRGPASVAQALYEETEASRAERARIAELRRLQPEPEATRHGRPSKRDRRDLDAARSRDRG